MALIFNMLMTVQNWLCQANTRILESVFLELFNETYKDFCWFYIFPNEKLANIALLPHSSHPFPTLLGMVTFIDTWIIECASWVKNIIYTWFTLAIRVHRITTFSSSQCLFHIVYTALGGHLSMSTVSQRRRASDISRFYLLYVHSIYVCLVNIYLTRK